MKRSERPSRPISSLSLALIEREAQRRRRRRLYTWLTPVYAAAAAIDRALTHCREREAVYSWDRAISIRHALARVKCRGAIEFALSRSEPLFEWRLAVLVGMWRRALYTYTWTVRCQHHLLRGIAGAECRYTRVSKRELWVATIVFGFSIEGRWWVRWMRATLLSGSHWRGSGSIGPKLFRCFFVGCGCSLMIMMRFIVEWTKDRTFCVETGLNRYTFSNG